MTGAEVRQSFLDFFRERGHAIVPSARIVPESDPSLLFTNAGMVQFKDVFLGVEKPRSRRVADSQKCLRISGKHNDLDDVGRDGYHQTFFEMLGNWSFGDYYKREAIDWAWELLTRTWGLPRDRLYATVYKSDDEAARLWPEVTDLPASRVLRFGEKDNFWEMGETGPCGPCSEIHFDRGPGSCDRPPGHVCGVNTGCARYIEIWNLVFIQNNRDASGKLTELPAKHVDTGMGLERVTALLQGKSANYDCDLLRGLITVAEELSGKPYRGGTSDADVAFRVIADHGRAIAVMIADGILPSNDGRGYVLRRLLRRAARQARVLGLTEPFLGKVTDRVGEILGAAYPELVESRQLIRATVTAEEERFGGTLEKGLGLLTEEVAHLRSRGEKRLSGEVAFRLYDTYGFPVDLTEDILRGEGLELDTPGFEAAMDAQRTRAREGARFVAASGGGLGEARSRFAGDRIETLESPIVALSVGGEERSEARAGEEVEVVVDETPFYAESGGQVGDRGTITLDDGTLVEVLDTQRPRAELIVHRGRVVRGALRPGKIARLAIDKTRRDRARLNHSATHILHAALRRQLGMHVRQAGSLVAPDRLRFDFTHDARLPDERLAELEDEVNAHIRENVAVTSEIMSYDDAIKAGALAFFGDKYGDRVTVLRMGDFSTELCGGTHVSRTGDIGVFKLRGESAVGAGVRRLEAVTGEGALDAIRKREHTLHELAELLHGGEEEVAAKLERLLAQQKELERRLAETQAKMVSGASQDLLDGVRQVNGISVLARQVDQVDARVLRDLADKLRDRLRSGVVVLGGSDGEKVLLLAAVTKDLTGKVNAGSLIKEIAPIVGGGGGGRPDFAQAGGKDPARLPQALARVYDLIGA
ncbi:MAG TPA: alanine--tRNA ligase [Candidatus Bathyarchaeia archaeon]|nr:alanine--tRNA ligase [Candidatus Bathyarchaeia archaeon]